MSEETLEEVVEETVVAEEVEKKTRKPRTQKVAEEAPVESVSLQEAPVVNDDGQKVITGPNQVKQGTRAPRKSNVHTKNDGVIGSHAAEAALFNAPKATAKTQKPQLSGEKIAVWSSKNIRWTGVGELSKGYNIVTKEAAEKWLEREGIREATPEEVATYYGK